MRAVAGRARAGRVIRLTRCVLAALAALAMTGAVAAPTSAATAGPGPTLRDTPAGSIGLRLIDAPVTAGDDPRARIYIVDHLAPGSVIHRRVEVSNTTASTAHIVLYPAAATIEDGAFQGAADRTPNDLSTWTSVSPDASDVPAGGRVTATATVTVPSDAAPGEQYGVVWAEVRSAPTGDGGVTQVSRVGIRIYLSVGPGGPPAANFSIDSLAAHRSPAGEPMVLATVHNTGGRALDMNGTLELAAGPGGLSAGPFPATLGTTLAIGASEPITIALDNRLPAGPWRARVTLRSGLVERSAEAIITFPDAAVAPAVATTYTRSSGPYIAIAIALVVLLLMGIAATLIANKRRPARVVQ